MDCYNVAIKYLSDKYGIRRTGFTSTFQRKLSHKNKKEQSKMIAESTDNDYQIILNNVPDENKDDKEIELLLHQYPFGYTIRFELQAKLENMKII